MMTSMLQEMDDIASMVIQEPPSSPSQMPCLRRKCRQLSEGVWSPSAVLWMHSFVARYPADVHCAAIASPSPGACTGLRHPGHRTGGGHPPVPPAPLRHDHVDPGHVEVERGEGSGSGQPPVDAFDSPNLDMPSFSLGLMPASQFSEFWAPPPRGTTGSSTPHQPISQASSSDEEEWADDMDGLQRYGFGHHVGKSLKFQIVDFKHSIFNLVC
ncbi:hypothetical protein M9H77_04688 [Catharanthus roseus]|uniref:Uncharacterized protein n=1 Tax=Catharanthus roseus TaxID=4058 RepID=A0ACC0CEZ2_CATRO|nr:hypothetical protein M9H77_04688 [Catharanthus roseus]